MEIKKLNKPFRIYITRNKGPFGTSAATFKKELYKENPFCAICNKTFSIHYFDLEHWIPVGIGGKAFDKTNVRLCCKDCHNKKTDMDKIIIYFFKDMDFIERSGSELFIFVDLETLHELYTFLTKLSLSGKEHKKNYSEWENISTALRFEEKDNQN